MLRYIQVTLCHGFFYSQKFVRWPEEQIKCVALVHAQLDRCSLGESLTVLFEAHGLTVRTRFKLQQHFESRHHGYKEI